MEIGLHSCKLGINYPRMLSSRTSKVGLLNLPVELHLLEI